MAATGTAPSSKHQWWTRASSSKSTHFSALSIDKSHLYSLHKATRGSLMTQVTTATTTKTMPSNAFTTSKPSSRFNFSAVLPSFATRSKKQLPLDIQDPPPQVNPFPATKSSPTHYSPSSRSAPSSSQNLKFSRGVPTPPSGPSRASTSTDGPVTPSDDHYGVPHPKPITSLVDYTDYRPAAPPFNDRRASSQSSKSIGERFMNKVEGRSRAHRRSPERNPALSTNARAASESLHAVEPPWQSPTTSDVPDSPTVTSGRNFASDPTAEGAPRQSGSGTNVLRRPKHAKPPQPLPDGRPPSGSSYSHQRTDSSTSFRRDIEGSRPTMMPNRTPSVSHRSNGKNIPPRPPPTQELPPTPSSSSLHDGVGIPPSSSASNLSFASSLSSLSFRSRPSPQDTPIAQQFPSLLSETLPGDEPHNASELESAGGFRRNTNGVPKGVPPPSQKAPSRAGSRPLPELPFPRERAHSNTSTIGEATSAMKVLRTRRSFHNTSTHAPALHSSPLRHSNSFEPLVPSRPPSSDLPSLPPSNSSAGRRSSGSGKDSTSSPRRRLFSSHKHERERERKREQEQNADSRPDTGTTPSSLGHSSSWYDEASAEAEPASPSPDPEPPVVPQHIVPPAELLRLGAAMERESESLHKGASAARRSSRIPGPPRSAGAGVPSATPWTSKLPRSASMFSKTSSLAERFASDSPMPAEIYTSLSPPPRRARPSGASSRRTLSNASSPPAVSPTSPVEGATPGGARIERKPSFLDMSTSRKSVSIDLSVSESRDSFLELSRPTDSTIGTIRETHP